MQEAVRLQAGSGSVDLDPETGAVTSIQLDGRAFVSEAGRTSGLVRMSVPTDNYPSHYLELGTHGRPDVQQIDGGVRLVYDGLRSQYAELAVDVAVDLTTTDDGLVVRARVENNSAQTIPQLVFPQLIGLEAVGGTDGTRLQLSRRRFEPFTELAMRPEDARWLENPLQTWFHYGVKEFSMKWLDYGDADGGLTVYSRDTRYTTQDLVLDRQARDLDLLDLRWTHYPYIAPGESWDSGDYVLLLHGGDWYAGARAFQSFARDAYPYHAPRRIREALAIRSVWPAIRNSPPTFRFDGLHTYAEEIADPDLGIGELVLWHWWLKNGLPMIIDQRLGKQQELEAALATCAELGVTVSMFVSHNILRQTDETDMAWCHLNAAGQRVENNWTYGRDFLPRFRLSFMGTHAMVDATPASKGWRDQALTDYAKALDYGGVSLCFDVFHAPYGPEYNPSADCRPDEAGVRLVEFAQQARELIHARNPEGSFSGEFVSDTKLPVLDYTWEWTNSYDIADAGPFRYVFPHFRLNANVGTHPRGALIAFMEDALLNLIPGQMHSHHLADHPDLLAMVRNLAALRRRFLPYFTEGQFRSLEGLSVDGGDARVFSHGEDVLIIAINPTDEPVTVQVGVDPTTWGGGEAARTATVYGLDGSVRQGASPPETGQRLSADLGPDDLIIVELVAGQTPS